MIQTARFDGLGRRVRKVVTNSGDLDGTTVYYHNRNQIIESRDGSGDLVQQMYHGTQYIDELVSLRIADLGRLYVHQAEGDQGGSVKDYNVVALSDMSGRFVERTYYSPYGQPEFVLDAHPFDYDDDGDVDETDIAAATTGGDCWSSYTGQGGDCKRLDADADRDIDADDHTAIVNYVNALPSDGGLQRVPSSPKSRLSNTFAHQGLVLDPEVGSYQNRARQYSPKTRRYLQTDPLGVRVARNLYEYGAGSPCYRVDPHGLESNTEKCIASQQPSGGNVGAVTLCDGSGGFMSCVQLCSPPQYNSNCVVGNPGGTAPGVFGPPSPTGGCPPPPLTNSPSCGEGTWCSTLLASCRCEAEKAHIEGLQQHHPNACQNADGSPSSVGSNPLSNLDGDVNQPGSYSYCYKQWSEIGAMNARESCVANNSNVQVSDSATVGGESCARNEINQSRLAKNLFQRNFDTHCQGFQPGQPWQAP